MMFKFLQVPVLYGAVVEGIATCLCRLASKSLGDLNPRFATAIDSFIGTSLVVAGKQNKILRSFCTFFDSPHSIAQLTLRFRNIPNSKHPKSFTPWIFLNFSPHFLFDQFTYSCKNKTLHSYMVFVISLPRNTNTPLPLNHYSTYHPQVYWLYRLKRSIKSL